MLDNEDIEMALVSLAIEKSLLDVGKALYDKVRGILKRDYDCYLPECYEHPEYLSEILKILDGNDSQGIIKTINEQLEEFSYHKSIARVLEVICNQALKLDTPKEIATKSR